MAVVSVVVVVQEENEEDSNAYKALILWYKFRCILSCNNSP